MKKSIPVLLCGAMFSVGILASPALAASTKPTTQQIQAVTIDSNFIAKVDKYVVLNSKTHLFSLSSKAKGKLTDTEYELAQGILNNTNKYISLLGEKLVVNQNNKTLKPQALISPNAINTSKYWDFDYHWWGPRLYLSHAAVDSIKANHANFASAISFAGPAAGAEAILVWVGVTSSIVLLAAPVIAGAIGAAVLD